MAGKNLSAFLTVDLAMNTTKFQKQIKGASDTTKILLTSLNKITVAGKKAADVLGAAFKVLGGLGAGAALTGIYALSRGALDNVKAFEDLSAKISGVTGDLQSAEKVFWELNGLEDETTISTQKLADSLLYLNKYGISVTSKDIKALSALSLGLNKDLETVSSAIGKATQGRYNELKNLGFAVQDEGNKLSVTFKGVTTEIGKDAESIKNYLSSIGESKFSDVLNNKLNTTDAALNRFKNAWGTLQTEIFRSDGTLGQLFQSILNTGTNMVNGLIQVFRMQSVKKTLDSAVKAISYSISKTFEFITGEALDFNEDWSKIWLKVINLVREKAAQFGILSAAFISTFKIIAGAFDDFLYKPIKALWNKLTKETSEWMDNFWGKFGKTLLRGNPIYNAYRTFKDWEEESADVEQQFVDQGSSFADALEERELAMKGAADSYAETLREIADSEKELENELEKNQAGKDKGFLDKFFGSVTGGSSAADETVKTMKSTLNKLKTEWDNFMKSLTSSYRNSLSERQQLEIEYAEKNQELLKFVSVAGSEEIANARNLIDQEYFRKLKALEENAQSEYYSIMNNETELLRIETQKRIDLITQMYNDQLLTSQQFAEAQSQLIADFYRQAGKMKKGKDSILSDESVEKVNALKDATQSLSDAFGDMATAAGKGSKSFKALFAIQKGFAVASATMNAILAWSQALSDPTQISWIAKLAQYANAIALTANILSQLKSVEMYDNGGFIKSGEFGIVGEVGPELVQGPAQVTSRKDTAELLSKKNAITVNLIENSERAGTVEESGTDDENIINIFVSNIRRGGDMAAAIENTYNLKRVGV
ncbi:TPA: hypothetical protein ACXLHC_004935 [Klebsiella pneumoniae]